jgi:hypothetical protein
VAPHRGQMSIQSPPSDQRINPEMDTSEYTKKFANDVARTGVGFRNQCKGRSVLKCDEKKKKKKKIEERTGVPGLARCSGTIVKGTREAKRESESLPVHVRHPTLDGYGTLR